MIDLKSVLCIEKMIRDTDIVRLDAFILSQEAK